MTPDTRDARAGMSADLQRDEDVDLAAYLRNTVALCLPPGKVGQRLTLRAADALAELEGERTALVAALREYVRLTRSIGSVLAPVAHLLEPAEEAKT